MPPSSRAQYSPDFLRKQADEILKQANALVFWATAKGLLLGGIIGVVMGVG